MFCDGSICEVQATSAPSVLLTAAQLQDDMVSDSFTSGDAPVFILDGSLGRPSHKNAAFCSSGEQQLGLHELQVLFGAVTLRFWIITGHTHTHS